jgi:glycosyltransferase involved in cell wall biosynthesis
MEIAMYQFSSLTQGEDTFFFDLASSLSKRGHHVHVITSNQLPLIGGNRNLTKEEVDQRLHGASLYELRFAGFIPLPSSIHGVTKILKKCDLLYTRNEIFELFPLKFFRLKSDIPVVCGLHTYTAPCLPVAHLSIRAWIRYVFHLSPIYKNLLQQCDAFHTLNKFDYNLLLSRYEIEKQNVFLIPPGIDTNLFHPGKTDRNRKLFKILFVGRLDEGKGIDILYQSINQLHQKDEFDKMFFTIVGNGELKKLPVELSQVYNNVNYLSFISRRKLPDVYRAHDITVIPSRWETFSYICLEAQSCGIPVITTAIPGPYNIVKHKETGLVIPLGDPKDLTKSILHMYQLWMKQNGHFNKMKKLSRKNVLKKYSLDQTIDKLEFLFERIVNQRL